MGYSHSWRYRTGSAAYAAAWPAIVQDTNHIVAALNHRLQLTGPDGAATPRLSRVHGIAFNGLLGEHSEPLVLDAPGPRDRSWFYCKTNREPYDLAVTATLLRCHLLLGSGFPISSDGDWNRDWRPARRLIKRLFDATVTAPPFTEAALPTIDDYEQLRQPPPQPGSRPATD